jgi:Flp pilus assembly protein TadD
MASGCATTMSPAQVAKAVDPSLRAAAISAEASHDFRGAAQHWATLYQRHPDDKGIALSLARDLRFSGEGRQASYIMQTALVRHGKDGDYLTELGKDYLSAERLDLAIKTLKEAHALDPRRWDVPSALGVCYDMKREPGRAAAAYAEALTLSPDNPQILNNLALSQALSGRLKEAIATLRKADDQPSADIQVRQNLALLLAFHGDAATAARLARADLPPSVARANAEEFRKIAGAVKGADPGP